LYDEISIRGSESGGDEVDCDVDQRWCDGDLAGGQDNLICRAISVCREEGLDVPPLRVSLKKVIPIGGGLGGGSGNAAGVLAGLNRWLDWGLSVERVESLAGRIGSDVPLFFSLPAAVMTGRGELVEAVSPAWSGWVVLVFGGIEVSTAATYAAWDELQQGSVNRTERATSWKQGEGEVRSLLAADTAEALSPMLVNDLEEAIYAVVPAVKELHDRVSRSGGPAARLSGAGATIYQLFDERDLAEQHLRRLREVGIDRPMLVARTHVCSVISY
jgi:4-diphosphocytidyl-2-C-methyl-D-erythritol kinase